MSDKEMQELADDMCELYCTTGAFFDQAGDLFLDKFVEDN